MDLQRRDFCGAIVGATAAVAAPALAQAPTPRYRIGILFIGSRLPANEPPGPLKIELERLGLVEGVNLLVDVRFADGDVTRLDALAADLVASKPDLIFVASGIAGARAAKSATTTIPIVCGACADPVGAGLVQSLARPGGNVTGGTFPGSLDLKRAQLLLETIGTTSPLFMLTPNFSDRRKAGLQQAFAATGLSAGRTIQFRELKRIEDLSSTFEEMSRDRGAGVVIAGSPLTSVHPHEIAAAARKYRLPAIADGTDIAEAGLLMSYTVDWRELGRNSARMIEQILKGTAKPAEMPIEQATKFDLAINMRTAKTLGIRVPDALLIAASRVIG